MKGEPEVSSTNRPAGSDSDHKPGGTVLKLVGMRDWISFYYSTHQRFPIVLERCFLPYNQN